jgi:two-component system cell cycle response regulator
MTGVGGRILLVEDTPHSLELMTYLMEAHGYTILAARSGEQGVEVARASRPDLVIMDLQLPGIDGYQALRGLRSIPELARTPVIAVTSFAMVGDRDRALDAGFDGYLTKPIDPETFAADIGDCLPEHLRGSRPTPAEVDPATCPEPVVPARPERHRPVSASILVLDDSSTNQTLLRSMLEPHGYHVRTAFTVEEAVACANAQRPDLVLSDVHVSHQRGADLLAGLQAVPVLATVPFAFLTATSDAQDTPGSDSPVRVIRRPIEPAALLDEVKALLAGRTGS